MMPNHNFDSKIDNQHIFESKVENQHRFDSILNIAKYFEGVIDAGYFNPDIWKATFTNSIDIVADTITSLKSSVKISAIIDTEPIGMNVNRFMIGTRIIPTAEFISHIAIVEALKMAMNFGTSNFQITQDIQARMIDLLKINSTGLTVPQVLIGSTLVAKQYYMLNHWDGNNLSDLDAMNLSDMDYQAV
jgi:hypothetical protein